MLYRKGYSVSFIQKVLRHQNPTTTKKYLRSLGLEDVREGMNEALSVPASIISFKQETRLRTGTFEGYKVSSRVSKIKKVPAKR